MTESHWNPPEIHEVLGKIISAETLPVWTGRDKESTKAEPETPKIHLAVSYIIQTIITKMPEIVWIRNNKPLFFIFLEAGKSKIKAPEG